MAIDGPYWEPVLACLLNALPVTFYLSGFFGSKEAMAGETPTLWLLDDALRRLHVASASRRVRRGSRARLETLTACPRVRSEHFHERDSTSSNRPVTTTCARPVSEAPSEEDEQASQIDEISTAVEALQEFRSEINEWSCVGPSGSHKKSADFAEYLTEKYLCQRLDPLGRSDAVTRIRKSIISQIDKLCRQDKQSAPAAATSVASPPASNVKPPHVVAMEPGSRIFRRGTAWKTISEAKRFLLEGTNGIPAAPAAAAMVVGSSPQRSRDTQPSDAQLGPAVTAITTAAASPVKKAAKSSMNESHCTSATESSAILSIWLCAVCTRKNPGGAHRCTVCGRARDAPPAASKVPFAGRVGASGISASLFEKLKAFQKSSIRSEKEVTSCETLGREIQDVLSTLRSIKTEAPTTKSAHVER